MKLLVTRPTADSMALASLLETQGHEVLIDPMLEVRQHETTAPALDGVTGLLFTSANGVRAFAAISDRRDIAVYAVGDRTAEAARLAGFRQIKSADGDVDALARLAAAEHRPEAGALLHVSGAVRAGNLAETLRSQGFTVHHIALYEAVPATALAASTQAAIESESLDGVLLFSPRTAKYFAELVAAAQLGDKTRHLQAWCLSQAVADALAPLRLAGVHIAAEPTQASLLKAVGIRKDKGTAADSAPIALGSAASVRPTQPPVQHRGRSWAGLLALLLLIIAGAVTWQQWVPLIEPLWHQFVDSEPKQTTMAPSPPATAPPLPSSAGNDTISQALPAESPVPPAVPDQTGETLTQRLDRLEAAVEAARINAASAAPKGSVTALQSQLTYIGQQFDALSARPVVDPQMLAGLVNDTKHLDTALVQLGDRLTPIEARVNQKAAAIRNDRTLVLAAGQIRDALAGSGSFDAPVAVIRAVAPEDADLSGPLAVLGSHAKSGVPSRVRLAQDLADLPAKLAEPAPLAPDAGPWNRVTDKLGRLVTIRRVDDGSASGTRKPSPDYIIANAGRALGAGDLAGAVQEMRTLDGPEAVAVKPWLDAAQARLDCEQAAQAIEAATILRLSASAGTGAAE